MITRQLAAELNCLRWVAALLVVISHIRNLLFVNYGDVQHWNLALKAFYFLTGFGHEAVIIFFVISGFLVGGHSVQRLAAGSFRPKEYLIHRFSRIYIVLIPALLAGFALDSIGAAYFDDAGLYSDSALYRFEVNFASQLEWKIFLANVLQLQTLSAPVLGSNGPLWSLAYEWWYYCALFCAIGAVNSASSRTVRTVYAAVFVITLALLPLSVVLWFFVWLLGTFIVAAPALRIKVNVYVGYAILFAVLAFSRVNHALADPQSTLMNFVRDFTVAAGCALFILALIQRQARMPAEPERPTSYALHDLLAGFSYTTYLVNFPLLVFMVSALNSLFGIPFYRQPSWLGLGYFLFLLIIIYVYSYAFSRLTERHTNTLRRWLQVRLDTRLARQSR